jgi:hypothetical protein
MTVYRVTCGPCTTVWDSSTGLPPDPDVDENDVLVTRACARHSRVILHPESAGTKIDWTKPAHGLESIREAMTVLYGPRPVTVAEIGP